MHSLNKGTSPVLTVRVPQDLLDRLDRECRSFGLSRSVVIRQILGSALDRAELEDAK